MVAPPDDANESVRRMLSCLDPLYNQLYNQRVECVTFWNKSSNATLLIETNNADNGARNYIQVPPLERGTIQNSPSRSYSYYWVLEYDHDGYSLRAIIPGGTFDTGYDCSDVIAFIDDGVVPPDLADALARQETFEL